MDDHWQLEAVHEQFDVFESLTTTFKTINRFESVLREITFITNNYANFYPKNFESLQFRKEVMNYVKKEKKIDPEKVFSLSFVVIVTNMKNNGKLSKLPVLVLMSQGKKQYIDLNLTVFNSWDGFLKNNNLPPCAFCFPVDGLYVVGKKLKIDFALSSVQIRPNSTIFWKAIGFIASAGLAVASFFFNIAPKDTRKVESLLPIAKEFMPTLYRYGLMILRVVTVIQRIKTEGILSSLPEIWRLMKDVSEKFKPELEFIYEKVKRVLMSFYSWIMKKFSSMYEKASIWARHMFAACVFKEDSDINDVESEMQDLLEASLINNKKDKTLANILQARDRRENCSDHAREIFRNAAADAPRPIKDTDLNTITYNLLNITSSLTEKLKKTTLKDAQDIFHALAVSVKYEYKTNFQKYIAALKAAEASAGGGSINIDAYNAELGIKGDPKAHFWLEAFNALNHSPLMGSYINKKIEELSKEKKVLIFPLAKESEEGIAGYYRCVGIDGAGEITAQNLIHALNESDIIDLQKRNLAINETTTNIMIQSDETIILLEQTINDNRSEGFVLIISEGDYE